MSSDKVSLANSHRRVVERPLILGVVIPLAQRQFVRDSKPARYLCLELDWSPLSAGYALSVDIKICRAIRREEQDLDGRGQHGQSGAYLAGGCTCCHRILVTTAARQEFREMSSEAMSYEHQFPCTNRQ